MSKRIGNFIIITQEPDRVCELCGKVAECRPYGPNGKQICFECAQKDKKGTEKRMAKILFGETDPQ
jgi:hypothetical protein